MTSVEAPVKDFIQKIRECKTKAEERQLVAEASASIRTALKEGSEFRFRNMVKLLYINMLGYPTHWAQMECLTLIHMNHYADKRAGYLALSLLLDETTEVLLLATNSIVHDLDDSRPHVQLLALNAIGNVSSETQARAAAPLIEKLLTHKKPSVRKKAILCAGRIVRKVPELAEGFYSKAKQLINIQGQDNGSVLTIVELMLEICQVDPEYIIQFRKFLPKFVSALKKLTKVAPGGGEEYDVQFIRDPFLQVALLKLVRVLSVGDPESAEKARDALAAVATNTDRSHNVGHAVLLEAARTILALGDLAEHELRVMALNLLAKFLQNPDSNIRYVALDMFSTLVASDLDAVQRFRNAVIECLQDGDTSIRRKAVMLLYALVDSDNVRQVVRELLKVLPSLEPDLREELTLKVCTVAEKYAPSPSWYIDTMLKMLSTSGASSAFPEPAFNQMIALIAGSPEAQLHAVQKMWLALTHDRSLPTLTQAALWCIGEYGDLLVAAPLDGTASGAVTPSEVAALLDELAAAPLTPPLTHQFLLNAAMKLTTRFPVDVQSRLSATISRYTRSKSIELQTRALEYEQLLQIAVDQRASILARMPAAQIQRDADTPSPSPAASPSLPAASIAASDATADLLGSFPDPVPPPAPGGLTNLLGDLTAVPTSTAPTVSVSDPFGLLSTNPNVAAPVAPAAPSLAALFTTPTAAPTDSGNLLGTTFESTSLTSTGIILWNLLGGVPAPAPAPSMDLASLLSAPAPAPSLASAYVDGQTIMAFQNEALTVTMTFKKPQPDKPQFSLITVLFTNTSLYPMADFSFQLAPPKHIKFIPSPLTASVVAPNGGSVSAMVKAANYAFGEKPMAMKIRISFVMNGMNVVLEEVVKNFPPGL